MTENKEIIIRLKGLALGIAATDGQINTESAMQIINDAIAALTDKMPRLMTLEEVLQHNNQDGCIWFEQPTYNAVAAFIIRDEAYTEVISPYILGEPIDHGYMANKYYGKAWRCWTQKPTDAQREAEKWND